MPTLLLVDDEADILLMLEHYLMGRRIQFSSFNDPLQALAHFRENAPKYDFVLTDIRMPEMSGDELAHHIAHINPKIKIVLMSAYEVHDETIKKADNVVDFLQKPFALSAFGDMLDKHLS